MNLKHLTDECLLSETLRFVKQERELLIIVLHHLREHERRRLFNGHSSLHVYAVETLGYPDDQAQRRIAAMRLLEEFPEVELKIESGAINLTHLGMAQTLFNTEERGGTPLSTAQKLEVFEAMAGKSTRKAQAKIQDFARQPIKFQETVRAISQGRNVLTIEVSDEVLARIEQLKGWLAHKDPHLSNGELFDRLTQLGLEQWNPVPQPKKKMSLHTKAGIRRRVWIRDAGACTECGSRFALQEDHILPESMGGEYTFENIRLLCRTCNQRAAIEKLGLDKMDPYFSPAAPRNSGRFHAG